MKWHCYLLVVVVFCLCLHKSDCGSKRIYGGRVVRIEEYPYFVFIHIQGANENSPDGFCGGSLISASWIVTALHCLSLRENLTIQVGMQSIDDASRVTRKLMALFFHPTVDLALIKVDEPFSFNRRIKPISLSRKREEMRYSVVQVAGYGMTEDETMSEKLRVVTLTEIDNSVKCIEYHKLFMRFQYNREMIWDDWLKHHQSYVCVVALGCGKASSYGDSGGPLIAKRESGAHVLLGVVTHGNPMSECTQNAHQNAHWIKDAIGQKEWDLIGRNKSFK